MFKTLASILAILMLLTGCVSSGHLSEVSNELTAAIEEAQTDQAKPVEPAEIIEPAEPAEASVTVEQEEEPEASAVRKEINIKSVLSGPPTGKLTVYDLKRKYEQESTEVLMPLYNVKQDEKFTFSFKADMTGIPVEDIISVHTDRKALPQSKIEAKIYFHYSGTGVVVKPDMEVMHQSGDFEFKWGQAPAYYIRVNYDMESPTPKKLDKPVITPFTVKSEIATPVLDYVIDESGSMKLTWNPIEGAEAYNVYTIYNDSFFTKINGAEEGYADVYPSLQSIVKVNEFDLTHHNGLNSPIVQNMLNPYGYYVTAVKGDQESNFGNMISIGELADKLPVSVKEDEPEIEYDKLSELPKKMPVQYLDDSVVDRELIYNMDKNNIINNATVEYRINGTELQGSFLIFHVTEAEYQAFVASHSYKAPNTGMAVIKNSSTSQASAGVSTSIAGGKAGNATDAEPDLIGQQRAYTKHLVAAGEEKLVPEPEILTKIGLNADSAAEEYLARNLIAGKTMFSLLAFPELQGIDVLDDYLMKVVYQNPQIIGVDTYSYDYETAVLHIDYEDSSQEMKRKQKETAAEASRIIQAIIHKGMTAEQKNRAIYDYLDENTVYDDAAAAKIKESDGPFEAKTNDAFSTYGIMVKKIGVCMSYASSYKMLADLAGLESIVVTGTLEGSAHAWIKVKIGSEWFHVDPTNGWTNTGIPYLLYNANDATAAALGYVQNDKFWLDQEVISFEGITGTNDYYVKSGLEAHSAAEFTAILKKLLKQGEQVISVRVNPELPEEELDQLTAQVLKNSSDTMEYSYGYKNYFIIWPAS